MDVAFLPKEVNERNLSATVCVVLDIFRATSSIVTAIANGCKAIVPVLSVEEARQKAGQSERILLAGERQSIKIEGFDLGNSPFEFSPDTVKERTIVMSTTNGTIAVRAVEQAYRTVIGSFLNAGAVCRNAAQYEKDILIVCAGTDGLFSLEDALCAGLLVELLNKEEKYCLTDAAQGALMMYGGAKASVLQAVSNSRNGRRLYDLGRDRDVEYCLRSDIIGIVPQYRAGKITVDGPLYT